MQFNMRAKTLVLIGLIVIIATNLIFSLSKSVVLLPHTSLGFSFIVFSEIVLFLGLAALEVIAEKSEQVFMRSGAGVVLIAYASLVFLSSVIYMNLHIVGFGLFLIVQIVMFVIAIVLEIIIITASKSIKSKNDNVISSAARVNNILESLILLKANSEYERQLDVIIEDLRYSDVSTTVEIDSEIESEISKLKLELAKNKPDAENHIANINTLIQKRKLQIKNIKVGGI